MTRAPSILLVAALAAAACTQTDAEAGGERFGDPGGFSESGLNDMSCATCHTTTPDAPDDRILPAYSLYGVVARESWWGGRVGTLLDAVNQCVAFFLRGEELAPDDDRAKQLYAYLESITPPGSPTETLPVTIVENVTILPTGDAAAGEDVYRRACRYCHGDTGTGAGGFSDFILPDDMSTYDQALPGVPHGHILVEVVRHGTFFGIGGAMPFFSTEFLTDEQISDLIAYLQLEN